MIKKSAVARLVAGVAAATVMAGCGHSTATTPKVPSRAPLQTYPGAGYGMAQPGAGLPGAPGMPGAPGAAGMPTVQQLLAAVQQVRATDQGFSANISTYEKGPDGSTSNQVLDVWWKKPNTLKIHIVKGDSQSNDCQVLWDGSSNMKVKPNFLPFAVNVSINDSRVVSKNGWSIKQTDVSCILNVLLDPGAQAQMLGFQNVDGKQVFLLDVHSPKSPSGVTHEQIGIDPNLNIPVVRLMYKGQTLAYKLVAKTFILKTPSSSNLSL